MNLPKMILFDYGQTLLDENGFDPVKGTAAVMEYAVENKYNLTPKQVQDEADAILAEIGRVNVGGKSTCPIEMSVYPFDAYLYESNGIRLSIPYSEAERIFWDVAAPGVPTKGIEDFLHFLKEKGIRTGVISNISYSGKALTERLQKTLPHANFEFIIASSDYLFRKPNPRLFRLALEKADLQPEDVWYIGDNYECDVEGAVAVGIFPVWYTGATRKKGENSRDVLEIEDWQDLQRMLEELVKG